MAFITYDGCIVSIGDILCYLPPACSRLSQSNSRKSSFLLSLLEPPMPPTLCGLLLLVSRAFPRFPITPVLHLLEHHLSPAIASYHGFFGTHSRPPTIRQLLVVVDSNNVPPFKSHNRVCSRPDDLAILSASKRARRPFLKMSKLHKYNYDPDTPFSSSMLDAYPYTRSLP